MNWNIGTSRSGRGWHHRWLPSGSQKITDTTCTINDFPTQNIFWITSSADDTPDTTTRGGGGPRRKRCFRLRMRFGNRNRTNSKWYFRTMFHQDWLGFDSCFDITQANTVRENRKYQCKPQYYVNWHIRRRAAVGSSWCYYRLQFSNWIVISTKVREDCLMILGLQDFTWWWSTSINHLDEWDLLCWKTFSKQVSARNTFQQEYFCSRIIQ